MEAINGSAEVIRDEADGDQRYRVARTEMGYLISSRSRDMMGAQIAAEWLHRTEEAALACLEAAMTSGAAFQAIRDGVEAGDLLQAMENAFARHNEICERLGDKLLVGD